MIIVLHNTGPEMFLSTGGGKIRREYYTPVATVQTDSLEEAFILTNNIDRSWTDNDRVQTLLEHCASTSTGDLLLLEDGRLFEVTLVGFNEVRWEE